MDDKTTQPSSDTHIGDSHLPNRARARVHAHGSQEGARAKKVKPNLHLYFTTPIGAFSLVRNRKKKEEEKTHANRSALNWQTSNASDTGQKAKEILSQPTKTKQTNVAEHSRSVPACALHVMYRILFRFYPFLSVKNIELPWRCLFRLHLLQTTDMETDTNLAILAFN